MPDVFTKRKRSEVMSRIRGSGNKETEVALEKLLRAAGIVGWRRQMVVRLRVERSVLRVGRSGGSVRPDFVFSKQRVAVFVDGCFWHGCSRHGNQPVQNAAFWKKKLTANKARDLFVNKTLQQDGWRVVRVWEHDLVTSPAKCVRKIQGKLTATQ